MNHLPTTSVEPRLVDDPIVDLQPARVGSAEIRSSAPRFPASKFPLHLIQESLQPLRAIQSAKVDVLVESMGRLGLREPVTIRPIKSVRDGQPFDCWQMVAGRHRAAAARRLQWTEIEATVIEDETEARLWEISENLHRADLTEAERRAHIAEWVKLTADKEVSPHDAAKLSVRGRIGEGRPEEAISKASKDLGISKDTVARAVAAEGLPTEVKAAADAAGLGTVARAAVAKEPTPEAQTAKIADLVRERAERKLLHAKSEHCVAEPAEKVQELAEVEAERTTARAKVLLPAPLPGYGPLSLPFAYAVREAASMKHDDDGDEDNPHDLYELERTVAKMMCEISFAVDANYLDQDAPADSPMIAVLGGADYLRAVREWKEVEAAWSRKRTRRGDMTVPPAIPGFSSPGRAAVSSALLPEAAS